MGLWMVYWLRLCRQWCTHLQICTRRSLEAKEEAESYSLVAGTPSTSIDLLETFVFRKTVFLPSFKKALCDRPPLESKCSQRKWKICCAQRKRAWQSMTCEKIFQKWTKFWRIRWTFLLCFSEILYIASAMSSWSALYQNWNKGRKRRKNQVVASLTSLSQQSRINHHASPSRQLMFNCTSVCRRELWSRRRRRSPRWWRWGGTQHGPAWHLLLPGLSYCWGKASKVRKRMFNSLYFIGNWVPGEWFKLGLLWVFCHPSRGAVCYRT